MLYEKSIGGYSSFAIWPFRWETHAALCLVSFELIGLSVIKSGQTGKFLVAQFYFQTLTSEMTIGNWLPPVTERTERIRWVTMRTLKRSGWIRLPCSSSRMTEICLCVLIAAL